jgi:protein-S-isoprenylcysteine O-methyltransferase Ste14
MRLPGHTTESRTASVWANGLKTLLQTALMWGFFLWAVPLAIAALENRLFGWRLPEVAPAVAIALFSVFGACGLYCGFLFARHGKGTPLPLDTATRFIVLGPYRWVRNPMAVCGIAQGVCVGLLLRSPSVVAYSLAGAVVWHLTARPWEERDLEARFGEQYARYRAQVQNWLPRLHPYPRLIHGAGDEDPSMPNHRRTRSPTS